MVRKPKKKKNSRITALCILMAIVVVLFSIRMTDIQIVNSSVYAAGADGSSFVKAPIKAARGEILDCYGRPLAENREGYDLLINKAYLKDNDLNDMLVTVTGILKNWNAEWIDDLPLTSVTPFSFEGDDSDISAMRKELNLNHYATAQNCFDAMVKEYKLGKFDAAQQRTIMGIRYTMGISDFSVSNPFTLSTDVSSSLMTYILESYASYKALEVDVVPIREYPNGTVAPHIIGTVGKIFAEEWEELKEKGYSYNDVVGKSGIEKAYEDYLKGEDGEMTYVFNADGDVISKTVTKEPLQGNTVMLSIDKTLQVAAQNSLKEVVSASTTGNITGASAVVMNVKTGQILAAANYPSYDINDYINNYNQLAADKTKPLFDRAFNGVYPPGSTFKPSVALTGLQIGKVSAGETINCTRKYTYFSDYQPSCMHHHGPLNIIGAISQSCNYFFFEVGRRIGITTMNEYCRKLGLGEYTGVELPESKGILAGPEYRESRGTSWNPGDTIQAAIGQSDNAFTPLQLANYTTAIANGGTRYKATLLKEIRSYSLDKVVVASEPEAVYSNIFDDSVINTVKQGMLSVTEEGTARTYFSDYSIKVGGKTGTAQNSKADHNLIVCFAPFDDPEIALAVVTEHGEKSTSTGPVARAILDAYFFKSEDQMYVKSSADTILR